MQLTPAQLQELRRVSSDIRNQPGVPLQWADRIDQCLSAEHFTEEDRPLVENTLAWNQHRVENRLQTVWQILEAPDLHDLHGFPGKTHVIYREHHGISQDNCPQKISAAIQGDTWLDIYRACDQAVIDSQDQLHIVIRELRQDTRDTTKVILITEALRT